LHIAPAERWEAVADDATSHYTDASLETEGFIHCSTAEQVLIPANERFAGQQDLVLLVIEVAAVSAEVIFEDCYESGMAFPHIYGTIPVNAVRQVVPFPCLADGSFQLPAALA